MTYHLGQMRPLMKKTIMGIDLAATFKKSKVGVAVIESLGDNSFALTSVYLLKTTKKILSLITDHKTSTLLAIDAPLKLPIDYKTSKIEITQIEDHWSMAYTYRPWEYLIFEKLKSEYKISGRPFSSLTITHRARELKRLLEDEGWKLISSPDQVGDLSFTEVFPNLTMGILKHEGPVNRMIFVEQLLERNIIRDGDIYIEDETGERLAWQPPYNEDILDAIICAWTGVLFITGKAMCLGDDKLGFVICPYTEEFKSSLTSNNHLNDLIYSHKVLDSNIMRIND
jgi:hypothetical protein